MIISKTKTVFTLFTLAIIITCSVSCTQQPKDDTNRKLAGMYKLYIIEAQDSTGAWKESPWAKGGESYILYDGLGHMAVQITPKGYKDFKWLKEADVLDEKTLKEKIDTMSLPQLKAAAEELSSNYVYLANYIIDDSAHILTHKRITSTLPSIWGTEAKRVFSFNGDTLTLINPVAKLRLVWIRQN